MVFTHYTKDNTRFVSSVHSTLDGMVCRFQQLEQMSLQDGNREHLIDWLGEVSTKEDYETVLSACEDGTCEWLLQCSEFQEWAASNSSDLTKVLWIHGPPGVGKTILCAWLVQYLRQNGPERTAYYFCLSEHEAK